MNWIVGNLQYSLEVWNTRNEEIYSLITQSPADFRGGEVWNIVLNINGALKAIGLALLVLFFVVGVIRTCGNFAEIKRPEQALRLFIRFVIAKGVVTYGLDLMLAIFKNSTRNNYNYNGESWNIWNNSCITTRNY